MSREAAYDAAKRHNVLITDYGLLITSSFIGDFYLPGDIAKPAADLKKHPLTPHV